jgi:CHAT domain-containing protein
MFVKIHGDDREHTTINSCIVSMYVNLNSRWTVSMLVKLHFTFIVLLIMYSCNKQDHKSNPALNKTVPLANKSYPTFTHPYLKEPDSLRNFNLDSAILLYRKASTAFKQEKNWRGYVHTNNVIGYLHLNMDALDARLAASYLKDALHVAQQYLDHTDPIVGSTNLYLGIFYDKFGNGDKALEHLEPALTIRSANFGARSKEVAYVLHRMGKVHLYLKYNIEEAERFLKKTLEIREDTLPPSDVTFSDTYYDLSVIEEARLDYAKAITLCYKALAKTENFQDDFERERRAYFFKAKIAEHYSRLGKFDKTIETLQEVVRTMQTKKEHAYFLSSHYNNLGDAYITVARYNEGIHCYRTASMLIGKLQIPDLSQRASTYLKMGAYYTKIGKVDSALFYFNRSLTDRLLLFGKDHEQTSEVYQKIGDLYATISELDSAVRYYHRAINPSLSDINSSLLNLPDYSYLKKRRYLYTTLSSKADVLRKIFSQHSEQAEILQAAFEHYSMSDTLIALYDIEHERDESKLNFVNETSSTYENAIDCAYMLHELTKKRDYISKAHYFIDKRKARVLLNAMHRDENARNAIRIPDYYRKFQTLQNYIVRLEDTLYRENAVKVPNEKKITTLHNTLFELEKQIAALKKHYGIKPSIPMVNPNNNQFDQLSAMAKKNKALIINYFFGDSAVYILGITKGKAELLKVKKTTMLEAAIANYQQHLHKGYAIASDEEDFKSFCRSAYTLYNSLFNNIVTATQYPAAPTSTVVIIPDGVLLNIPFESLIVSLNDTTKINYHKLPYLLKYCTISYEYSGELLMRNSTPTRKSNNEHVLALSYSTENTPYIKTSGELSIFRDRPFQELPGTAQELKAIASCMHGQFYFGKDASEQVFKEEAKKYAILHLAVHGQSDFINPSNSKLIFKADGNSSEDGNLYPHELYDIEINPGLVVLSACESGIGKSFKGEGTYSLARGFFSIGCSSIVTSLWRVHDTSTAALMEKFYRELSNNKRIDHSLQEAKLSYIDNANSRSAHPSNWASFIAIGNTQAVVKNSSALWYYVTAILVISLSSAGYIYYTRKNKSTKQLRVPRE